MIESDNYIKYHINYEKVVKIEQFLIDYNGKIYEILGRAFCTYLPHNFG